MAHISSIAAAMFTDLSVAYGTCVGGVETVKATPATFDKAGFDALFLTATSNNKYFRIRNVREFPAIGATPNIVNVPVYGSKVSQSVGGQSDAPNLEVTINYVPSEWAKGTTASTWTTGAPAIIGSELANMIGDGVSRPWRMTLLATAPVVTVGASLGQYDSIATGIGTVPNSMFYFMGKLESLLVTPSLTDATTATMGFSLQSDFYGAFTV